jgi:hypothetical protein
MDLLKFHPPPHNKTKATMIFYSKIIHLVLELVEKSKKLMPLEEVLLQFVDIFS